MPIITLLGRFTLVSLATTIAVGLVFGTLAVRLAEDYALTQHAHSAAVYVSEFLAPRLVAKDFLVPSPAGRVEFEFALRGLIGKAGILRVTVWSRAGEVLYSDAAGLAGRTFPASPALRAALSGRTESRLVSFPEGSGSERAMEVFVPVVLQGAARPVAVYDIVSDLKDLDPTLRGLRRSVWADVIAGLFVLYAALFTIVRGASRELQQQHATLQAAFGGAVRSLAAAVNARDAATADHSDLVADLAAALAQAVGMSQAEAADVRTAAFLHDVGKIGLPDNILDKHGPLTREERAAMQRHARTGYEILLPVPISAAIKAAVLHHHEWWNGNGYPDGLTGEEIPVAARVIAVADAYGALTADRPYRPALDPETAMAEIERRAGTQFDPAIVATFQRIRREHAGTSGGPAVSPAFTG